MGSHKSYDRHFPVLSTRLGGYSGQLVKGQFGIFDMNTVSKDGAKAVTDFSNFNRNNKFELRLGKAPIGVNRSQTNMAWASLPFKLSDVVDIKAIAPNNIEAKFDEQIIGYDGHDPSTAMEFKAGDNVVINLELSGEAMGILGYKDSKVMINEYIDVPECDFDDECVDCDPCETSCRDHVARAIERLKAKTLLGSVPITDYVEITPVLSCTPADAAVPTTDYNFNQLEICDAGDSNALAQVQAQYPDQVVTFVSRNGNNTIYQVLAPAAVSLADFDQTLPTLIKGCDACPAGYTEIAGGFVYSVTLEDDGVDSSAVVETLANAAAGTAVKHGQNDGVGTYSVVLTAELSEVDRAAFIAAGDLQSTATLLNLGEVEAVCENTTVTSTAWTVVGTCTASEKTFRITLPDNECGNTRLAELQANYTDLVITELADPAPSGCQRTYETTVATNIVCDECDPIFNDTYSAEAPLDFDLYSWIEQEPAPVVDQECLCGIRVKGKETILTPDECLRDEVPFISTSVRIKLAGGYPTEVNESVRNFNNRFAVKVLSKAEDRDNLAGNFWAYEDMAKVYFDGSPRHFNNNYAKFLLGEESHLIEPDKSVIDYAITIRPTKYSQSFSGRVEESITYHIIVPVGEQQEIENLLNSLAAAAGVDPVKAIAG